MNVYIHQVERRLAFLNLYKKPIAFCQVMLILILQLPFEEINSLQSEHFYISTCTCTISIIMPRQFNSTP